MEEKKNIKTYSYRYKNKNGKYYTQIVKRTFKKKVIPQEVIDLVLELRRTFGNSPYYICNRIKHKYKDLKLTGYKVKKIIINSE